MASLNLFPNAFYRHAFEKITFQFSLKRKSLYLQHMTNLM